MSAGSPKDPKETLADKAARMPAGETRAGETPVGKSGGERPVGRFVGRRLHLVLYALMVVAVAGIVVFAWLLISTQREYSAADNAYDELRVAAFHSGVGGGGAGRGAAGAGDGGASGGDGTSGSGGFIDNGSPHSPPVDFEALSKINEDIVGWVVGGEKIDYPIVRGSDNVYYLTHLVTGERRSSGSLFMDYRNAADFSDQITVIWGHNMKNGSMFGTLKKYKEAGYYEQWPTLTLYTPGEGFVIELFTGVIVDGNDQLACSGLGTGDEFLKRVKDLKAESTFKSNVVVTPEDRMIALCTCTYERDNARYAVFGKLVPLGGGGDGRG